METTIEVWLWIVAAAWACACGLSTAGLFRLSSLPEMPEGDVDEPRVLIVVPARDEARRIEGTLQHLRRQRGVDLAIAAIDDRSTDGTGPILDRVAADDPRVTVIHVTDLPDGWLGKCHACHVGAALAENREWILFTDGDTWIGEDVLARAIHAAEAAAADHVCVVSRLAATTVLGRAIVLIMFFGVLREAAAVNRDGSRAYVGMGAFNLVRRAAYEQVGGHERLRLEVLEDIGLGYLLRRAGFRPRIFFGPQDLEVEWITDLRAFFAVTEKNYFALFAFRALPAFTLVTLVTLLWVSAVLGPLHGSLSGWCAAAALGSIAALTAAIALRYRWSPLHALLTPLMVPVALAGIVYSACKTLRQGGVRWRGQLYPIAALRDGIVRRR